MPLPREVEYWEKIAKETYNSTGLMDNVWKRRYQINRLLKYSWFKHKVLEVGVGNGVVAGAIQVANEAHWDYLGTELSPHFRECAANNFNLKIVEADVRELPGSGYTRIIAMDSLEHVRPEHRKEGYARIFQVAAKGCLLFIHLSKETSCHDNEFDHPFGVRDFVMIEDAGFTLKIYEAYKCEYPPGYLDYAFVVFEK